MTTVVLDRAWHQGTPLGSPSNLTQTGLMPGLVGSAALEEERRSPRNLWWLGVAAIAVVLAFIGGGITLTNNSETKQASATTTTVASSGVTTTIAVPPTTAPAVATTLPVNVGATPPQQVTAFQVQVTITYAYGAVVSSACTGIHTVSATSVFDDEHCAMTGDTANFVPGTYSGDPVATIWFIHGADTKWYSDFPGESGAAATSFTQTFVGDPGGPFLEHVVAQYAR